LAVFARAMKHLPFDSIYRPDFEVVEKREGAVSYFPHTDQLPILHRALNLEFRGGLPSGIGKVNAKSDGLKKMLLAQTVAFFCNLVNGDRKDGVTLFRLYDRDLLARNAVVQQITESTRLGKCHRFRFYGGADFQPEVYLSGKEIIFAEHVLERFKERAPHVAGTELSLMLFCFMGGQCIAAPVNGGRAFLMPFDGVDTFLAFPYKESESEYFITTCLSMKEVNHLEQEFPTEAFNFHYDREFIVPEKRNWTPPNRMIVSHKAWKNKVEANGRLSPIPEMSWHRVASFMKEVFLKQGHQTGSELRFLDDVPGPSVAEYAPGLFKKTWSDAEYANLMPEYDWAKIFRERDEQAKKVVPVFEGVGRNG
jgi:hypothetical protein